ncbi:MarR family winged helix-turn-helix transcriptional regulator, partial [Tsukamurella soli]
METDDIRAIRAVVRLARHLESAAHELNLAQYRVLAAVSDGDERASRVAARLALGKPTVSASVDALCRRGLLVRGPASDDHRAVCLRVTPDGEALLRAADAAMIRRLEAILARTPDAAAARAGLAQLAVGLDATAD